MQIVNTMQCNLSCDHCLWSCEKSRKNEHLSHYAMARFLDECQDDFCNICGGEIFMNPDWLSQLTYISWRVSQLRIVTNGTLLVTPKENLSKIGRDFVEFLNSVTCDTEVLVSDDRYHTAECVRVGRPTAKVTRFLLGVRVWNDYVQFPEDGRDNLRHSYMAMGRALENGLYDYEGECTIEEYPDFTLAPNGKVYACCNLRGYVGECTESYSTWRDRFSRIKCQQNCLHCKLDSYERPQT